MHREESRHGPVDPVFKVKAPSGHRSLFFFCIDRNRLTLEILANYAKSDLAYLFDQVLS